MKLQIDREIQNLNETLVKMADIVLANIKQAFTLYKDDVKCEPINDDVVDQYERLVEELCLDILIKERPYSKDLRMISGILKLVSDLERIGDHAEDVINYTIKLKQEKEKPCIEVEQMLEICMDMLNKSIDSYLNMDINKANEVIAKDDVIDKMFDDAIERLISKDSTRSFAIYTTLVVKYIERIADHATNIAEWVVYMVNGFYKDKKIF
ncbi:MAG: phosphate signaling complex protein PhoU [Anaeroplasmataceae bacterium]